MQINKMYAFMRCLLLIATFLLFIYYQLVIPMVLPASDFRGTTG